MSDAIAARQAIDPLVVEHVLIKGDLKLLTPPQKVAYYKSVCESLGLNPLTQPFAYIVLNGKETLYAKRDAAEQLRKIHDISIDPKAFVREVIEGVYVVTAAASMPSGRTDVSTGAVAIDGLKGEARANAMLKAETKAKRRVTLSICGLGMLDETETDSIPNAVASVVAPVTRITLPEGTVQVVDVVVSSWGGDVTVVDKDGVETVWKTASRECAELAEQLQQARVPVQLVTQEITRGKNQGKQKLVAVKRWSAREPGSDDVLPGDTITADDIGF
jgi:hypothetical protein